MEISHPVPGPEGFSESQKLRFEAVSLSFLSLHISNTLESFHPSNLNLLQ